jgi:hypothetical protein
MLRAGMDGSLSMTYLTRLNLGVVKTMCEVDIPPARRCVCIWPELSEGLARIDRDLARVARIDMVRLLAGLQDDQRVLDVCNAFRDV